MSASMASIGAILWPAERLPRMPRGGGCYLPDVRENHATLTACAPLSEEEKG
jgi:hypothetical protein